MKKSFKTSLIALILAFQIPLYAQYGKYKENTLDGIKWGIIKKSTGDTVIPARYDGIAGEYSEGYFLVINNNKQGVVDINGNVAIPLIYSLSTNITEGRAFVSKGGKLALVNNKGTLLTQYIFDDVREFSDGMAMVFMNNKAGFINKTGTIVIPCKYDDASDFVGGLAIVYITYWDNLVDGKVTYANGANRNVKMGKTEKRSLVVNKLGVIVYKALDEEEVKLSEDGKIFARKFFTNYRGYANKILDKTGKVIFSYDRSCNFEYKSNWIETYSFATGGHGMMTYEAIELYKPNFRKISELDYNGNSLARIYYDEATFFYIDANGACVEFDNVKCPK